uniref:Sister chromatid cohesion protein n=1 Tax=Leptocylindrus danicus TaxID=163516 RepID=A0A7S2JSU1_9STRA|mmetsp:Transcript_10829/g.16293  ORF Transcript_10829/g.16293 Transcript_10829/m.16293 type:complete len:1045 (+) Transcript_10829:240-3374(+)
MRPKLALVEADDDCDIDVILNVLADEDNLSEERFGWIPEIVAKCLYYSDASDSDMRSRVIQIIDDVLVPKSMSVLARSVGLAIVLRGMEGSGRWMEAKLSERASLQAKLAEYVEKRPSKRETPEEIAKFKLAFAVLQEIPRFAPAAPSQTLQKLHQHKDKHVFRLLGSIASCNHSEEALGRATSDVSKRCSSFPEDGLAWMKALVRRVGMGSLLNGSTVKQSAELALEAFNAGAYGPSLSFLQAVSLSSKCMPCLGSADGDMSMFEALVTLFEKSSSESKSSKLKGGRKQDVVSVVSTVSTILANIAPSVAAGSESALTSNDYKALRGALMKICLEGGDAIMARNAVLVLGSFCKTTSSDKAFAPLLKELTAPHRLSISNSSTSLHTILASLSALAECASAQFCAEERAGKAVQFALKLLLKNEGTAHGQVNNNVHATSIKVSAIQLVVAYIRASLKHRQKQSKAQDVNDSDGTALGTEQIKNLFQILADILDNDKDFELEIKRAATIGLLRLCDSSLPLQKYLTSACYVSLSRALAERDTAVILEFNAMARASKPYSNAPSLRLLAMSVSFQDDSSAKNAVIDCVNQLRATCELLQSQNPTLFDSKYKVKLMPEYVLPYSLYLLAHAHSHAHTDGCEDGAYDEDGDPKKLTVRIQKQLRMVLDPLVQSPIGEADNISFLLRIMEMIGHSYSIRPAGKRSISSMNKKLNDTLRRVCKVGRDMLLKGVKHDSQLAAYPHHIQLPANLFYKVSKTSHGPSPVALMSPKMSDERSKDGNLSGSGGTSAKARVSFSSDVQRSQNDENRQGNVMGDGDGEQGVVHDGDDNGFELDVDDGNAGVSVVESPSNDRKRPANAHILSMSTSTPASRSSQPRTPLSAISTAQSEISELTPPSAKKAARSAKKMAVMIHKPQSSQSSASVSSTRSRRSSTSKRKSPDVIDEFDFEDNSGVVDVETKRMKMKNGSSKEKAPNVSKRSISSKKKSPTSRKSVRGLGKNSKDLLDKSEERSRRSIRSDGADESVGSRSIRDVPRRSASVRASSRLRQK